MDLNLIGTAATWAALLGAAFVVATGLAGGFKRREDLSRLARIGTYFVFGCMTVAVAAMEIALLTHDFSVQYVAEIGSREMPTFYTAISLWGSLNGSILFWGWILTGYATLASLLSADRYPRLLPFANAVLMIVGLFFFGLLVGPAKPFGAVYPVPADGPGPNPLLQNHPLMGLHPPMLYLGYVGLAVPFSFAIGALLNGRLDASWLRATRRWTLAPWAFLSVGIVAGAWWSYDVLGWGGYWAWDPVENASFLPWLAATAFLHSSMVQERRGMLKTWNLSLIVGTFLLTLLGTFLTRSGVLESVHAFTEGPIGPLFLGFVAFVALSALCLIAWRSDRLHAAGSLDAVVSRESAFVMNNLLLVAFTFTVLLGTMFPLVVEAVNGSRVSVGPPYFDMVTVPIGLALLFLMGVGPALPWRRTSADRFRRAFRIPALVGLICGIVPFALGMRAVYPLLTLAFAGFVLTTIVEEFRKGMSARMRISGVSAPRALFDLLTRNRRRYGGYVVHTGIVVIIVALAVSGHWRHEREATLNTGERVAIGSYQVQFDRIWGEDQPRRFVVGSSFSIFQNGKLVGTMEPRMNFYHSSSQPIATPAVRSSPKEDLYLTLMSFDRDTGRQATVKAIVNPGVPWLWAGGMIVAIGAILAVWPQTRDPVPFDGTGAEELPDAGEPSEPSGEPETVEV